MVTALPPPGPASAPVRGSRPARRFAGSIWLAPLVPVALAFTAGIVLDRQVLVPPHVSLIALVASAVFGAATALAGQTPLALLYLLIGVAALGAFEHHARRDAPAEDDIGLHAGYEPRPAALRGVLDSEPAFLHPPADELRSFTARASTRFVVRVTAVRGPGDWAAASGRVQVTAPGRLPEDFHVGDELELVGLLALAGPPANPGGFDYAERLQDRQVSALLTVRHTAEGVTRRAAGGWSVARALALLRAWALEQIRAALPEGQVGLASALLLGDGSALTEDDWERYQRSGVLHVLAISGQHLVVLAGFLWVVLRLLGAGRRRGAVLVALFVLAYALLTGGRPPALRSAAATCALCGSVVCRRPLLPANALALAWLVVAAVQPADVFDAGCQLSFLAVAVLTWGVRCWGRGDSDPLDRLVDEARPAWQRGLRWLGGELLTAYAVTLAVWLAVTPLVAFHFHTIQPAGLPLGPVAVLLTSGALLTGFALLLVAPLCWPLAAGLGWLTGLLLGCCDGVIEAAVAWRGAYVYVPDVPLWWVAIFYAGLLAALTQRPLRRHWRWALAAGLGWLALGLLVGLARPAPGEFRCTFLAVGHGGCAVLETPDGRTLLYDVGALTGPEVTRRHVAPYLWHRGVRRIDEMFLSHADLDHFNGVPALLERFAVGQVTTTPTFARRGNRPVEVTRKALARHGVGLRVVRAGDRLAAGEVTMDVLHPPAEGPEGNENARSLVLLIRHGGHTLLLTGDLEGPGLERVLGMRPPRVDVLQAPHHGSPKASPRALAEWAQPRVAVACRKRPLAGPRAEDEYAKVGARLLGTWPHGAVTVRSSAAGLTVETYRTGLRLLFRRGDQAPRR
jgi:competence protein ComEC